MINTKEKETISEENFKFENIKKFFLFETFGDLKNSIIIQKIAKNFLIETLVFSFSLSFSSYFIEKYESVLRENLFFNNDNVSKLLKNLLQFFGTFALSNFLGKVLRQRSLNNIFYFIKSNSISKFHNLGIEDKISKKSEITLINDEESLEVAEGWTHAPAHFLESLSRLLFLYNDEKTRLSLSQLSKYNFFISIFSIIIITSLNVYLAEKYDKKREELRNPYREEGYLTEKEISKSILIDSMGLKSNYLNERNLIVNRINNQFFYFQAGYKLFNGLLSASGIIFPIIFLLLYKEKNNSLYFIFSFGTILGVFNGFFDGYRELKDLALSCKIIDKFLLLDERNENISGFKTSDEKISSICFDNVSFAYRNSQKNVIQNYSKFFSFSNLTRIGGKNGTGKSTILYLTLGIVEPSEGRIFVRFENGNEVDLKSVNLRDWREKTVAYISHENLFDYDKGSTGQRQIINIEQIIFEKSSAQIFIFDEADNSLDEENRSNFYKKVDELVEKGKIVILVSH